MPRRPKVERVRTDQEPDPELARGARDVKFARKQFVLQLMRSGLSQEDIEEQCEIKFGVDRRVTVHQMIREIRDSWHESFERDRGLYKAEQVERVRNWIASAAAAGNWGAVSSLERTYADIVGTKAPLRIAADPQMVVHRSIVAIVSAMTPAELEELAIEEMELMELADKGRAAAGGAQVTRPRLGPGRSHGTH